MSKFNFNEKEVNNNREKQNKKGVLSNLKPAQKMLLVVTAIFVVLLVAFSGFMAFIMKPNINDNNAKVAEEKISQKLLENKTFQGLNIQDIEIESTDSITHLMANITNSNANEFPAGMVDIVFLDGSGKEMGRVPTYIDSMPSKGQIRIDTVIKKEYKNAANFKVEAQS